MLLGKNGQESGLVSWIVRSCLVTIVCVAVNSAASAQQVFSTPQEAADALVAAVRSDERGPLLRVLGRSVFDILSSGDKLTDTLSRSRFIEDYARRHRIATHGDGEATLVVGADDVPFPIPLIRSPQGWQFDITTGRQEVLRARIVRNERKAIEASLAYVKAQFDYAEMTAAKEGTKRYAERIMSRPGQKDGLYWPTSDGENVSPLNDLIERAKSDGYPFDGARAPYHGYFFKVLHKQGAGAPGGSFDYSEDGKMVRGFALIAYPVQYGHSGVLTFMVNQSGIVYQKDLGAYSTRSADRRTWFNPDQTWRKVPQADAKRGQ